MDLAQDTATRLVDLTTMRLHQFPINDMPAYLAISHVWSEELFAPIYLDRDRDIVRDCQGMDMLRVFLQQRPQLPEVHYCWADTWCIDQDDPEDKARQIPFMYSIYKEARYVAVVVKHLFLFSQSDWDAVHSNLQRAFACWRDDFGQENLEAISYYSTLEVSNNLNAAIKMIEEVVSLPWFKRIWTAQEYILARDIFWLGLDSKSIHFHLEDPHSVAAILILKIQHGLTLGQPLSTPRLSNAFREIGMLTDIRNGQSQQTIAILLALSRRCTLLEDEIYGLMAASGVTVTPVYGVDVEMVWRTWWERAIRDSHVLWIMMATSNPQWNHVLQRSDNCARPHSQFRFAAIASAGLATLGIRPYAPLDLYQGTVRLLGRVAGVCEMERYLGQFEDLASTIDRKMVKELPDIETVIMLCHALAYGHSQDEIATWARWIYKEQSIESDTKADLRKEKDPDEVSDSCLVTGSRFGDDNDQKSLEYGQEPPRLNFGRGLPVPGRLYLTTMHNRLGSTAILVNAAEIPKGGQLLAIDVGARIDNPEEDPHRYEGRLLLIVHLPEGVDRTTGTLHKVGTTSPVFLPEVSKDGLDKFERARMRSGYVLEDKYELLRIGGESCSYCHPTQRSGLVHDVERKQDEKGAETGTAHKLASR